MLKTYVIVRTLSAGVFAGTLDKHDGQTACLKNVRRLWYWAGASSLSQLAVDGPQKPKECKFPVEVPQVYLTQVLEILEVTETARKSIAAVPVWKQ